jgi:hypothetical protein
MQPLTPAVSNLSRVDSISQGPLDGFEPRMFPGVMNRRKPSLVNGSREMVEAAGVSKKVGEDEESEVSSEEEPDTPPETAD